MAFDFMTSYCVVRHATNTLAVLIKKKTVALKRCNYDHYWYL